MKYQYIRFFDEIGIDDIPFVGGKNASLVEMYQQLMPQGVNVPNGFAITIALYPRPVVIRMSDFKSNEYAFLIGGRAFEPVEANPMIGFHGAARYTHPAYEQGFALECAVMKRVREVMGLINVILMILFCRRIDEGERVLAKMAELG